MASAQEYAQVTELSQRVAEWEEKIIPKLRQEVRFRFSVENPSCIVIALHHLQILNKAKTYRTIF